MNLEPNKTRKSLDLDNAIIKNLNLQAVHQEYSSTKRYMEAILNDIGKMGEDYIHVKPIKAK